MSESNSPAAVANTSASSTAYPCASAASKAASRIARGASGSAPKREPPSTRTCGASPRREPPPPSTFIRSSSSCLLGEERSSGAVAEPASCAGAPAFEARAVSLKLGVPGRAATPSSDATLLVSAREPSREAVSRRCRS
eukprot:6892882-Prymnesium_polylepis.1